MSNHIKIHPTRSRMNAERDELLAQAKAEQGKVQPLIAAVWGLVFITGAIFAYSLARLTVKVVTATWGDVSDWFS